MIARNSKTLVVTLAVLVLGLAVERPCLSQESEVGSVAKIDDLARDKTVGNIDLHAAAVKASGKISYGMYVGDLKVGYRVENIYVSRDDPDTVVEEIDQEMSFYSGRQRSSDRFKWRENSRTLASLKDGLIKKFDFYENINGRERTIVVYCEDDHYNVTTTVGKFQKRDKFGIYGNYILNEFYEFERWLTSSPLVGSTVLLDGNSFTVKDGRVLTTLSYCGKVPSKYKDQNFEYRLEKIDHMQDRIEEWYDQRGRLLHSESGRFLLRKEDDLTALKYEPPEASELSRIPISEFLDEAQKERMVVLLKNSSAVSLFVDRRQKIDVALDGNRYIVATIVKDYQTKLPEPLSASQRRKYLAHTKSIQSNDAKIKSLAAAILNTKKSLASVQKAELLQRWVFENIEKRQSVDIPSALEVLEKKRGDCTEHSLLLVALLRASGVPAREVHGLVYSGRKKTPVFAGHRWVEFHNGHQWVSVDPTVGKLYVPATYISFGSDTPVVYELLGLSVKVLKTQAEIDSAKP